MNKGGAYGSCLYWSIQQIRVAIPPIIPIRRYSPQAIIIRSEHDGTTCVNQDCLLSSNPIVAKVYRIAKQVNEFFSHFFKQFGVDNQGTNVPFKIGIKDPSHTALVCRLNHCEIQLHEDYATLEIICHEFAHAITHHMRPLAPYGQAAALRESFGDIFGIAFKHCYDVGTSIDWTIVNRDVSQPIDISSYKNVLHFTRENDFGHAHDNSRIPSHAFYLAVQKYRARVKDFFDNATYGKICQIWFKAALSVDYDEDFQRFSTRTIRIAKKSNDIHALEAISLAWQTIYRIRPSSQPRIPLPFDQAQIDDFVKKNMEAYSKSKIPNYQFYPYEEWD